MGVSEELPVTGYIKMIDVWMIFTISYPFLQIFLHSLIEVTAYSIGQIYPPFNFKGPKHPFNGV